MTEEAMIQYAIDEGFSAGSIQETGGIVFDPTFRSYCEENLCGQYGINYSCPPDCGTPEEMKRRFPGARVSRATRRQCPLAPLALAHDSGGRTAILVIQPDDALRAHLIGVLRRGG